MTEAKPYSGLGEFLRSEREKRNITIEQVASATKINVKLLHALESDNYDALPAKPFIRGFVTSYTRYVGLDHREVLSRFDPFLDEKSGRKFRRPEDAPHIFVEREGQVDNSKTVLSLVMGGFLVLGIVVFIFVKPSLHHHHSRAKDHASVSNEEMVTVVPPPSESSPQVYSQGNDAAQPAPPSTTTPAPEPKVEAAVSPTAAPAPAPEKPKEKPKSESVKAEKPKPATPKPESKESKVASTSTASPQQRVGFIKLPPIPSKEVKYRLVVRAKEDAWVKYQVDDRPVQQYTLRKDKVIWVRAREALRFTTAKPTAVEISRDNKEFEPFGSAAKVIILPKSVEAEFKNQPFVAPNPIYLSTPNN